MFQQITRTSKLLHVFLLTFLFSCGPQQTSSLHIRELSSDELVADFTTMMELIRSQYVFLDYKFTDPHELTALNEEYLEKIKSVNETSAFGLMKKYLKHFNDPHNELNFKLGSSSFASVYIPIGTRTIGEETFITSIDGRITESCLSQGDKIISIDQKTIPELLETYMLYETLGNPKSNLQLAQKVFHRLFYMTEIIPTSEHTVLELEKPDGTINNCTVKWIKELGFSERIARISLGLSELSALSNPLTPLSGAPMPFFITNSSIQEFNIKAAKPSKPSLEKFGLNSLFGSEVFAGISDYKGTRVLTLRIPHFREQNWPIRLKIYKAIIHEFSEKIDILVIDQTRNPGGSGKSVIDFYKLFAPSDFDTYGVRYRADRKWLKTLDEYSATDPQFGSPNGQMILQAIKGIEKAYDNRSIRTDLLPFDITTRSQKDKEISFDKPMIVLMDELSASSAELFALLMKRDQRAVLFGEQTAGAGGGVEFAGELPYSGAELYLSRTSFHLWNPDNQTLDIENIGVAPDVTYSLTRSDLRSGYTSYVRAYHDLAHKLHQKGTP